MKQKKTDEYWNDLPPKRNVLRKRLSQSFDFKVYLSNSLVIPNRFYIF